MIEYKVGDILAESTDAVVNTVNCVGYMGRGIALQFKRAYPDNFKAYAAACRRHEVVPGRMLVHRTDQITNPRYIINFPTKRHWRGKSRIEDIDAGLEALEGEVRRLGISSIAIPPLGAGLGGLDWSEVKPRIERMLQRLPNVRAVVFEPQAALSVAPAKRGARIPRMTPGRAALVQLVERYLKGLLDPFVSLLEVHKLMYFMQEAGQDLRLRYVAGPYGPYAENLRHVIQAIDGYYITGYGTGGDAPDKQLELVPGAVKDAATALEGDIDARHRFDRVAGLVEGFESPFGLELLATVHWIAKGEPLSVDDLIARTYAWGPRKRQFSEDQIRLASRVLAEQGWIEGTSPASG
ncbi:MAG: macro domain-containing protein [Gemmatimonadales bacterium]|nr:macro domain-containing protein [Gemmatimonadales bacterium]